MDNQLLLLLKEVSVSTRLQILGLLGQMPRSGDELAALLELKPSTVSHHLTRLQKVGLVSLRTEQYYGWLKNLSGINVMRFGRWMICSIAGAVGGITSALTSQLSRVRWSIINC